MALASIFRKLRNLYPAREDLRVLLYTRQGCHLCDVAWQQLTEAQHLYRFRLDRQDVDEQPELVERYGKCVPVVTINDKVRFRGKINPVLLRRLLVAPPS